MRRSFLSRIARSPIVIGLACCLLAGCGKNRAEGEKPVELVLLTAGGSPDAACLKQIERLQKDHPDIHVEIITAPGNEYYTKAMTMMAGRARLDVVWMGSGFDMFASRGALLDLNSQIKKDPDFDLSAYFAPIVKRYQYEGKFYGFPYGIDIQVMAYNQDLFDKAGAPHMNDSWTLEDLVGAARKLTRDTDGDGRVDQYGLNVEDVRHKIFGADILTENLRKFALNTPEGLAWLKFNIDLVHKYKVMPSQMDDESVDRLAIFCMGRVAIVDCYTWDLPELKKRVNFRWDVAMAPKGKLRSAWVSSSGFAIAGHTQHPWESWLLLKYLVSREFQKMVIHETIPTYLPLQTEFVRDNLPIPVNMEAFIKSLPYMNPSPRIGCKQEVNAEIKHWRQLAFLGKLSPEEALAQAELNVNKILEEYRNP
ncbi:MAG: sugar ABC transporter substrate-binding protein [Verrucomicrobia bacterium]|nr:sugar ABC transporter substrate-binding protein [Verrucomicrobiota bacterium]